MWARGAWGARGAQGAQGAWGPRGARGAWGAREARGAWGTRGAWTPGGFLLGSPQEASPHSQPAGGGPREATIEAPQAPLVHLENAENGVTKNNSQFSSSSKKSKVSHPEDLKDSSPPIESRLVPASVASPEASYGPSVSQRQWSVLARGTNKGKGVVDVGRMAGTHWCGLHHTTTLLYPPPPPPGVGRDGGRTLQWRWVGTPGPTDAAATTTSAALSGALYPQ